MNRLLLAAIAAIGLVLVPCAAQAHAQGFYPGRPGYYTPFNQPRLSPYLGLQLGNNPAVNYFLGTVPEVERRATQTIYGNAITNLQRQVTGLEEEEDLFKVLPGTGHPAAFANYGGYFPALGQQRLPTQAARPPSRKR
jgi:hypothetical protein